MDKRGKGYFFPNRLGRIIFLSAEEILGQNGVNAVLNLGGLAEFIDNYPPANQKMVFSFETISRLQTTLDDFYGPRGGRGVALRIGRACFQHMLREYGPLFGLTDLAFRLLPLGTRLKMGASAFADIFNRYTDQKVRLEDKGKTLLWHIECCPFCWERQSSSPACQFAVGLLQEAMYWASGGKYFIVEESQCIAKSDPTCTIVIEKTPMS
ncbi:MAG TPA: 4-vinyl reductase [Anaerolineales bacterium]|jgi:predicted hydrocarbon binding protein